MTRSNDTGAPPAICLTIREDDKKRQVELPSLPAVIGRSDECDLCIKDRSVSLRHAMFSTDADGRLLLTDLGSTNGVYVNRRKIERATVELPVELRLGNVVLIAALPGQDATPGQTGTSKPAVNPEARCYYRRNGNEHGPYTRTELIALTRKGALRHRDLVWTDETDDWLRADLVPWLSGGPEEPTDRHVEADDAMAAATVDEHAGSRAGQTGRERTPAAPRKRSRHEGKRHADIVCPHCWHRFDLEEFLYIARHHDLVGDPVLGPEAHQRFLPSRFTPEGHAVDSAGLNCPDMACPRCHLRIPKAAGEMPPLFASIVGAPASGKSYFLTTMVWQLRNLLPRNFAMSFTDTDAVTNQIINEFEEKLFLNPDPDGLVALRKTELQGELYNQVILDSMITNLPKPFMFSLTPAEHHPQYEQALARMSRTLVLYDNAGEHFEPGMDSVDNPTTQHICYSDTIFFLFDPTKDVRFRQRCQGRKDPQLAKTARVQRQEVLLTEMINRFDKYSGKRAARKSTKTLIVLVPKSDIWLDLLGHDICQTPWQWDPDTRTCTLDVETIMATSFAVRSLLQETCPEIVSTAESFAGTVLFLPNTALGRSPELDPETGMLGIRPRDIRPFWISIPMLYLLYKHGLIAASPHTQPCANPIEPDNVSISGDIAFVDLGDDDVPLQVPILYMGYCLRCPRTGRWFRLPETV